MVVVDWVKKKIALTCDHATHRGDLSVQDSLVMEWPITDAVLLDWLVFRHPGLLDLGALLAADGLHWIQTVAMRQELGYVLTPTLLQATIDAADRSKLTVPGDGLAMVTITPPIGPSPPQPVPVAHDSHVQLLMDFGTPNVGSFNKAPEGTNGAYSQQALLDWAARYPDASFVVIGRCDDIGSEDGNLRLANQRADRGRQLLSVLEPGCTGTPIAPDRIYSRGEQSLFTNSQGDTKEEEIEPALSLPEVFVKPTTMLYRNLLAMETEELLRSYPVDGAVLMGGCDKTTPAMLMGALSMNIPAATPAVKSRDSADSHSTHADAHAAITSDSGETMYLHSIGEQLMGYVKKGNVKAVKMRVGIIDGSVARSVIVFDN